MGSSAGLNSAGSIDRSTVEQIVRQVALEYLGREKNGTAPVLTVQASSRHMHVCREDMDVLFGPGTELTYDRALFQEGNFAAKETVTIVGPRSRLISNLRILGPMPLDYEIHQSRELPLHAHVNARLFPYSNVAGTLNLPSTLLKNTAAARHMLKRR